MMTVPGFRQFTASRQRAGISDRLESILRHSLPAVYIRRGCSSLRIAVRRGLTVQANGLPLDFSLEPSYYPSSTIP